MARRRVHSPPRTASLLHPDRMRGEEFANTIQAIVQGRAEPEKAQYDSFRTSFFHEALFNPSLANPDNSATFNAAMIEQDKAWHPRGKGEFLSDFVIDGASKEGQAANEFRHNSCRLKDVCMSICQHDDVELGSQHAFC